MFWVWVFWPCEVSGIQSLDRSQNYLRFAKCSNILGLRVIHLLRTSLSRVLSSLFTDASALPDTALTTFVRAVGGKVQVGTYPLSWGHSAPPRLRPLFHIFSSLLLSVIVYWNLSSPYPALLSTSKLFKFSALDPRGEAQRRGLVHERSQSRG